MAIKISVLVAYFLIILCIGLVARTKLKSPPETYFLADRQFGTLILLGTMVATNFSAFTVFGTSGAGYRDGYAFFPIMGFGTGFMALTFSSMARLDTELTASAVSLSILLGLIYIPLLMLFFGA